MVILSSDTRPAELPPPVGKTALRYVLRFSRASEPIARARQRRASRTAQARCCDRGRRSRSTSRRCRGRAKIKRAESFVSCRLAGELARQVQVLQGVSTARHGGQARRLNKTTLQGPLERFADLRFEHILFLDVVITGELDAAFQAGLDFLDLVLEALERLD